MYATLCIMITKEMIIILSCAVLLSISANIKTVFHSLAIIVKRCIGPINGWSRIHVKSSDKSFILHQYFGWLIYITYVPNHIIVLKMTGNNFI